MEKMDKNEAQYKKMTEEPVGGLILSLAVPTIISMIVTAIYNTADTYFVSQLGTSASGAVGLATFLSTGRQGYAFLPLIVLLPHFIGLTGVEVAQPIADVISFAICVPYTIKFIRELNQVK